MRSSTHAGYGGTGGMKRRVPATRKGEPVLAAISLPPLTDDANRHTPTASHLGDHRTDRFHHIQPPGQHKRRQQRVAHPAPPTPQPRHEDLPAAARRPHMTPIPGPQHQRPGAQRAPRARDLHPPASSYVGIDRQRARPYHGHGDTASDPSPRRGQTTAGRDPSRSTRTAKSSPAQTGPGSNIAKEHGRRPGRDAQIVRPLTGGKQRRQSRGGLALPDGPGPASEIGRYT